MSDELEQQLRDDLRGHADASTSHLTDAAIADRWHDVQTRAVVRELPARPRMRTRVLVAAAGVAAVAVIGAGVVRDGGGQEVTSATPSTTEPTVVAPTTTVPDTPSTIQEDIDDTPVVEPPDEQESITVVELGEDHGLPAAVLATASSTPETAAITFLRLVDIPVGKIELRPGGEYLLVESETESGEVRVVSQLRLAGLPDGTVVVLDAQQPGFVELDQAPADHIGPMFPVAGRGHGFEALINLRLHATDGSPESQSHFVMTNPYGEMEAFVGEHPVAGSGQGWVYASSSDPSGAIEPFAAVPGGWASGRTGDARVFRISPQDPDGGLVLRADPDGASDRLGVIPAGDVVETFETEGNWTRVRDARGVVGWAGSTFLTTADAKITDEELLAVGAAFERAFVTERGNAEALAAVPWTDDYVVPVGWTGGMIDLDVAALTAPGADGMVLDWAIPDAYDPNLQSLSLASFLRLDDGTYDLVPRTSCCLYGNQAEIVNGWFAGLPSVSFIDQQDSGFQHVHLFVEPTPAGPQIVGVAVEIWVP